MEQIFFIVYKINYHVVMRNLAYLLKSRTLQSKKTDIGSIFEEFFNEFLRIDVSNIVDLLLIDHVCVSHFLGVDYLH